MIGDTFPVEVTLFVDSAGGHVGAGGVDSEGGRSALAAECAPNKQCIICGTPSEDIEKSGAVRARELCRELHSVSVSSRVS